MLRNKIYNIIQVVHDSDVLAFFFFIRLWWFRFTKKKKIVKVGRPRLGKLIFFTYILLKYLTRGTITTKLRVDDTPSVTV